MDKPFSIGEILLELLCVSIMLLAFITGISQLERVNESTRVSMFNSDYQREYANLRRFSGMNIAYTEALNAIYENASETLPVIVTSEGDYTANNNPDTVPRGIYSFPLSVADIRDAKSVAADSDIDPARDTGVWTDVRQFDPVPGAMIPESQYRIMSDFLADVSRSVGLVFTGRILRTENGEPFAILFTY